MIETVLLILVLIVSLSILVFLERRSEKHDAIFTGTATPIKRLVALVLGIVSAGAFLSSLANGSFGFLFLVLALALISYAFGARGLINIVQGRSGNQDTWKSEEPFLVTKDSLEKRPEPPRIPSFINDVFRILIKLGGMIIISAGIILAAILTVAYPDSPLTMVFVIIFTILFIIGFIRIIIFWSRFL